MRHDIEHVLIGEEAIHARLDEMAREIVDEIARESPAEPWVGVVVLTGAMLFAADLMRRMPGLLEIECLHASSYHGGTVSSGTVELAQGRDFEVTGRHLLVIDDILDSGRTLAAISEQLRLAGAATVRTAVLLARSDGAAVPMCADYVGFRIGAEFVVGYGLDFRGRYRNLPYIGVLKPAVVAR